MASSMGSTGAHGALVALAVGGGAAAGGGGAADAGAGASAMGVSVGGGVPEVGARSAATVCATAPTGYYIRCARSSTGGVLEVVVSQKGVLPTGPPSALMVVQLGDRPSGSQQNRSPHRRYWLGVHPNCPQRTTRPRSTPHGIRTHESA